MKDKIIAVTSTVTALTAFWIAITALFESVPLNLSGAIRSRLPSMLNENVIGVTLVMLCLVGITIFLQFDKIQTRLLPILDPFLLKFSGATAILNFLCLVLSAFIVLSMIQLSESQKLLASQLQTQQDSILQNTSTLYLDTFPGNTQAIRDLYLSMSSPSDELIVILDYPSYGSFSAVENYLEIADALRKAAVGFNAKIRMCSYSEQLARKDNEGLSLVDDVVKPHFKTWKETFYPNKDIENDEQYLAALLAIDKTLVDKLAQGDNFESHPTLTEPPPIFLWLLNKKTAVFSFPGQNETFKTSDVRLIEAFLRYSDKYCP